jgi:surfeit locus 1 family protein
MCWPCRVEIRARWQMRPRRPEVAKKLLTRRWILTTVVVLAGMALCIRLGIWQLDRLAWRREFNQRVEAQILATPLDLNQKLDPAGLYDMEYRSVQVVGTYDSSQEVLLRNQIFDNHLGFHVFTPLKIAGSDVAILVERGWIPVEEASLPGREKFNEPGQVTVKGRLRRPLNQPEVIGGATNPTLAPGQSRSDAWSYISIDQIQPQISLKLVPVYLQQAPDPAWTRMPYRELKLPEISEGPHMGYALQWFSFATLLGAGYPFFVRKQLRSLKA